MGELGTESSAAGAWTLQDIVIRSISLCLRQFITLTLPVFLCFSVLLIFNVGLAAMFGKALADHPIATSIAQVCLGTILTMACFGINGAAVLADLKEARVGAGRVLAASFRKIRPLFAGALFYTVIVLVLAAPGFFVLWQSIHFSMQQKMGLAMACILSGGVLLYAPLRLSFQWILFGFVVMEEEKGGWAALRKSREYMRLPAPAGRLSNSMVRVLILLHVSLVPALAIMIFLEGLPLAVLAMSSETFLTDLQGATLNKAFLISQMLQTAVAALVVPIFSVPLAVLYRDITARSRMQDT